jgi:hypothetical protein
MNKFWVRLKGKGGKVLDLKMLYNLIDNVGHQILNENRAFGN